jgi:hypothetical protein
MSNQSSSPCVLTSVANEIEGAGIVTALAQYGIDASMVGGFTAGFNAEAPGCVQVLVRQSDLDQAQRALAELHQDDADVDWSKVDVGEPED